MALTPWVLLGGSACAPRQLPHEDDPAALSERAAERLTQFDFQGAGPLFARASKLAPHGGEDWKRAAFGEALALWQDTPGSRANALRATRLFEQLTKETTEGEVWGLRARLQLGVIAESVDFPGDRPDRNLARRWYEEVLACGVDHSVVDEAMLRLAGSHFQDIGDAGSASEGVRLLREWLEERPANLLAGAMWQCMGEALLTGLGDRKGALEAFLEADERDCRLINRELFQWRVAVLAREQGRLDVAIRYFQALVTQSPWSTWAQSSARALRELAEAHPELEFEIPEVREFGTAASSFRPSSAAGRGAGRASQA